MITTSSSQKEIPAGMIDLGIGQPSPWLLPVEAMQKAAAHCAADPGCVLLAYGAEQGDGHFRLALSRFLEGIYGMPVDPAHLLVTNGASQAIDMICTLFSKVGDTIFVEEPTYFLARKIFADHHLKPMALPMDADGLIIEAVEDELKRIAAGISLHHPDLPQPDQRLPFRRPAQTAGRVVPELRHPGRGRRGLPPAVLHLGPAAPAGGLRHLGQGHLAWVVFQDPGAGATPGLASGRARGDRAHRPMRASRQRRRAEPLHLRASCAVPWSWGWWTKTSPF